MASDSSSEGRLPCCPPDMHPSTSAVDAGATKDLVGEYKVFGGSDSNGDKGVRCYIVSGAKADADIKGVVIFFHDIFGFNSGRTHHMCDEVAEKGEYLVLAPDFFGESTVEDPKEMLSFSFFSKGATLISRTRIDFSRTENVLKNKVLPYIRQRTNADIGAVGFCWGAWAVVRAAGLPEKLLSCGVGAHPSIHNQMLQKSGPTMDEMFKAVNVPILFCPAWNDPSSVRDDGYYMQLLREHGGKGSKSVLFNRQMHGFANRADIRVQKNKEDVDKFMAVMMEFFKEHIKAKL